MAYFYARITAVLFPKLLHCCSQNDCISFCRNHCIFVSCLQQVKLYRVYCGQWSGGGISFYKAVKEVGVKAKTMTNLLILLTVLATVFFLVVFLKGLFLILLFHIVPCQTLQKSRCLKLRLLLLFH